MRYLTRNPIFIPFDKIIETKIGKWHGGKWIWGYPILKIIWMKDNLRLSSGFFVSKKEEDVVMLKNILDVRIKGV